MKQFFTQKLLVVTMLLIMVFGAYAQDITALYLVGDAAPNGWNIGDPTPMVQDAGNAQLFTWQGVLKAGELKVSTFKGDWCDGQWLNAATADQPIDSASYVITNGCDGPDNKWRVAEDEAGVYLISIDLSAETIVFTMVSSEVADATLSAITLSEGTLEPAFDPSVKKYTVNLPDGTASVDVSATTTDTAATVSGGGVIDLSNGDTNIELVVTGADGIASETYTISFVLVKEG
ncbi:MAG: SusF/SusE family outer membrane protein, partial [Prolixibacteraceae bacterium]|nr:SusF/SusE family outer membrane protein [Prolixibacteraceae bacterium]